MPREPHEPSDAPYWANEILSAIGAMRKEQADFREDVCTHFASLEDRVRTQGKDLADHKKQTREALSNKNPSDHDLQTQADLAAERINRETQANELAKRVERIETKTDEQTSMLKTHAENVKSLESKTDVQTQMLNTLAGKAASVFAKPSVRALIGAAVTAATLWLTLWAHAHAAPQQTPFTQQPITTQP